MKKIATIIMLVAALLCGTDAVDAKTTKRASKAQTSQTSSNDMWNGDIPTGKNICTLTDKSERSYYKKGYREGEWPIWLKKNGVCSIEIWGGRGGRGLTIKVYNASKLNWLYQDLKKANAKYKTFTDDIDIYRDNKEIWVEYRD